MTFFAKSFKMGYVCSYGEVPEWLNGTDSKSVDLHPRVRGFESHPLRTQRSTTSLEWDVVGLWLFCEVGFEGRAMRVKLATRGPSHSPARKGIPLSP